MSTEKRVQYGLKVKATGKLAEISVSRYDDDSPYGDYFSLDHIGTRTFLVDDPKYLVWTLMEDASSYNSSDTRPSWGSLRPEELEPVKVETTVTITPEPVKLPTVIKKTVYTRDWPRNLASRYVEVPPGKRAVWVLVADSMAAMQALEGEVVHFGTMGMARQVLKAIEVPEEHRELLKGQEGAVLICVSE